MRDLAHAVARSAAPWSERLDAYALDIFDIAHKLGMTPPLSETVELDLAALASHPQMAMLAKLQSVIKKAVALQKRMR